MFNQSALRRTNGSYISGSLLSSPISGTETHVVGFLKCGRTSAEGGRKSLKKSSTGIGPTSRPYISFPMSLRDFELVGCVLLEGMKEAGGREGIMIG